MSVSVKHKKHIDIKEKKIMISMYKIQQSYEEIQQTGIPYTILTGNSLGYCHL